jgi:hypothetical protein
MPLLEISKPMALEVNGTRTDTVERYSKAISAQELPASPVPKNLDDGIDPAYPAQVVNLNDPSGKRRTIDFLELQKPNNHRITQIIDFYSDGQDERLSHEIELIRAAARKYPENEELNAASEATYFVDENGESRPGMRDAIDKVLGKQKNFSFMTESSRYSAMSNIIQPLAPKPAASRDEQPRSLLRAMDERKELETRLLNIQRALSERRRRKDVVSQHSELSWELAVCCPE